MGEFVRSVNTKLKKNQIKKYHGVCSVNPYTEILSTNFLFQLGLGTSFPAVSEKYLRFTSPVRVGETVTTRMH